jgi:hypothetical protein
MTRNEFYELTEEWISKDKESWNHVTLMAYFYYKYKQKTGVNFIPASWKSNPALTKECRDFSKLFKIWAPSCYDLLDVESKSKSRFSVNQKIFNYINWMFDYKFRYGGKVVTGTGIFLNHNMLNEFEVMYNTHLSKNKESHGIATLIEWAKIHAPTVLDSHQLERVEDLGMISRYVQMYQLDTSAPEHKLISKAKELKLI